MRGFSAHKGQVQQKECTGKAVVKSGKLYTVQRHVNQLLRVVRPMLKGRRRNNIGNYAIR